MNYIYYYIALFLNDWENHFSITEKNNSLAKKLILFDFVNSYSSLFYIAFIKPYHEGCIENNCLKEIETQMYSIFFVYLSVFFAELFYLYMIYQIMKHLTISLWSLKPRFDELRKINEENLKFRPFLDAKIKELCEKREKSNQL